MIRNQQGLTLAELLVVTAIILIMTAITIPNWNEGGAQLKVIRSAHQINEDIRRAQELTLANTEFSGCAPNNTHGYGLQFEKGKDSYELFAECGSFDGEKTAGDAVKEEIPLEEGVEINDLLRVDVGGNTQVPNNTTLVVAFKPPNPEVEITVDGHPSGEGFVEVINDGFCRRIKTNKVGLVGINDCQ